MGTARIDRAIAVFPAAALANLGNTRLRKRLSRGRIQFPTAKKSLLLRTLNTLDLAQPTNGHAALRMFGQTDDRPRRWLACADPVYMEPQLDSLCLHSLDVPAKQLQALFSHLQSTLGGESGFINLGKRGYVHSPQPIGTALFSSEDLHLEKPDRFLPSGEQAADYRRLVSEIEMALHEHPVNTDRMRQGLQPVNSLWLWGGGELPGSCQLSLPVLYASDPLFRGFWLNESGQARSWNGTMQDCFQQGGSSFVAVDDEQDPEASLSELIAALDSGRLRSLSLLFADGHQLHLGRRDRLFIWRRNRLPGGISV